MKKTVVIIVITILGLTSVIAADIKFLSPDKNLELRINVEKGVTASLFLKNIKVFDIENIQLVTDRGIIPSEN